jgi:hypothetical protein
MLKSAPAERRSIASKGSGCLLQVSLWLGSALPFIGAREGAKRFFFENPDYQLRTIELQTDGTLQREQI